MGTIDTGLTVQEAKVAIFVSTSVRGKKRRRRKREEEDNARKNNNARRGTAWNSYPPSLGHLLRGVTASAYDAH